MAEPDKNLLRQYRRAADALLWAMDAAVHVQDPQGLWPHAGFKNFARKYSDLVKLVAKAMPLPPLFDLYDTDKMGGQCRYVALPA